MAERSEGYWIHAFRVIYPVGVFDPQLNAGGIIGPISKEYLRPHDGTDTPARHHSGSQRRYPLYLDFRVRGSLDFIDEGQQRRREFLFDRVVHSSRLPN